MYRYAKKRVRSVFYMKLGIVGLPNVGKSTLFNAITSTKNAEAANYPFCTIEPNSGIHRCLGIYGTGRRKENP